MLQPDLIFQRRADVSLPSTPLIYLVSLPTVFPRALNKSIFSVLFLKQAQLLPEAQDLIILIALYLLE